MGNGDEKGLRLLCRASACFQVKVVPIVMLIGWEDVIVVNDFSRQFRI
jgi:hypothetical protein